MGAALAAAVACGPFIGRAVAVSQAEKRQSLNWPTVGGVLIGAVALSLLLSGCPDPRAAVGVKSGCQRVYGVNAVDRPETSRLTCAAIDHLTDSMPSEPETFLQGGDLPRRVLWKCKFYGSEAQRVLLRCAHHSRHFSVVKSTN